MLFYIQPLEAYGESILLELIFRHGLSDQRCCVPLVGAEDITDAYQVTPQVLFDFVKCDRGQACNVYVREDDGSIRTFPVYKLAKQTTVPSLAELAAMRCRCEPEPLFE